MNTLTRILAAVPDITRVGQYVSAHNFYNLFQQQQRPYNHIIFRYIPRALQCTCSSVPEASGCPQKKMSLAEQQATHALLLSLLRLR